MNSFRAVFRALYYEAERQREVLEAGGRLIQETRGWVEERGVTVSQRTKEYAHDYRYFPEPDLPPVAFSREWVEKLRTHLPELPDARRERFIAQYGLPYNDAELLTNTKAIADFFEACLDGSSKMARAKSVSNWMQGELMRLLNLEGQEISQARVIPQQMIGLLDLIDTGTISTTGAKEVFEQMFYTGKPAAQIIEERGLTQISETSEIDRVVTEVLAQNPQAIADYKGGKPQAVTFLVGQVMKATKGRANPGIVNKLLQERLEGKTSP